MCVLQIQSCPAPLKADDPINGITSTVPARATDADSRHRGAACSPGTTRIIANCPGACRPRELARGVRPDPYRVWLSEVMLQQTTVEAVKAYFRAFLEKWPTVEALAAAPTEDVMKAWAGLGYYSRARNLKACADLVAARGGGFPGHRGRPARPARHRRLHGGGDRGDRLRPAGGGGRRQCRAGHLAAVCDRDAAARGQGRDPRAVSRRWCRRHGPATSPRR